MYINKEFLQETARAIYGKAEFCFENGSYPINRTLRELIDMFMHEAVENQPGCEFIMDSLSSQISINLLRQLKTDLPEAKSCSHYTNKQCINRAIEFLYENYNCDYSSDKVASQASLSPYHFIRIFKEETGKTPYQFLMDIKIEKAMELLQSRNKTITEACFLSGFKNLSHFTAVFKNKTGVSPSEYRKAVTIR
jgi:AraC-like DNA-binding protein